jgi:hypothetical protein
MKLSSIVCASIATLASIAFAANGAFASVNYNSSKSNSGNFTFEPGKDNGQKLCDDAKGTVHTGPGNLSTCVVPAKAALSPTPAMTPKQ